MKLAVVVVALAACHGKPPGLIDQHTNEARAQFPTLEALYASDQGVYRGCGPNGGVCHNANEFPNLHTVGSILDNIGQPCNQKRTSADSVDDLCEPPGDRLAVAGQEIELAWVIPDADDTRRWHVELRDAPSLAGPGAMTIMRGTEEMWHLDRYATFAADPSDARGLIVEALPVNTDGSDPAMVLTTALATAGVPADPESVRVGDPNRNGVFGAELGGRLIAPGDPAASYLLHRLTDPSSGPLMPRANCCSWSLAAVRAMWCWIGGLSVDGSNAMDPIDYDHCSPSPDVDLVYPELGPTCETSGGCPVSVAVDDAARFPALYTNVLSASCSGATCHDRVAAGGVDFSSESRAFTTLLTRVVPGDPDGSILYQRITPGLCTGTCEPMPLGRDPLPDDERELIRAWITAGAPSE